MSTKPTLRKLLFRRNSRAEFAQLQSLLQEQIDRNSHMEALLEKRKPKHARLQVEGLMAEETALGKLAGTCHSDPVQAIEALLNHRIVQLSDTATNHPGSATPDERLFDSGGVHYLAEFLATLQDYSAEQEEVKS